MRHSASELMPLLKALHDSLSPPQAKIKLFGVSKQQRFVLYYFTETDMKQLDELIWSRKTLLDVEVLHLAGRGISSPFPFFGNIMNRSLFSIFPFLEEILIVHRQTINRPESLRHSWENYCSTDLQYWTWVMDTSLPISRRIALFPFCGPKARHCTATVQLICYTRFNNYYMIWRKAGQFQ